MMLQAPTPNPALYKHNRKQRGASHGPMDKYVRPCSGTVCRLRSASAPVAGALGTQTDETSTCMERLTYRRKAVRGQCPGMLVRSHSAQVQSATRGALGTRSAVGQRQSEAKGNLQAQQLSCLQSNSVVDGLASMAENVLQAPAPELKVSRVSSRKVPAPQPSHGPMTRSRAAHNGELLPIISRGNASMPPTVSRSGSTVGRFSHDGKGDWRGALSARRCMGTSLSADHPLGHRAPTGSSRRLRSPHASLHATTGCTRRRSDSPAADVIMDVDSGGDAVDHVGASDARDSCARMGRKEQRTPLRKQNPNVMKVIRPSRQPLPRTRSAGHAYKLRSRSRPPNACDKDGGQISQCDTH